LTKNIHQKTSHFIVTIATTFFESTVRSMNPGYGQPTQNRQIGQTFGKLLSFCK
jgi:hypothetical protein